MSVFEVENSRDISRPFDGGGSNKSIAYEDVSINGVPIVNHDLYMFKENAESLMELAKIYVFKVHFWVCLTIIFLAATHRVEIFSICYIVVVFIYISKGTDFYEESSESIIKQWDWLLILNVVIISMKFIIKFMGCQISENIPRNVCWLTELVGAPACSDVKISNERCKYLIQVSQDFFFHNFATNFLI